MPIGGSYRVSNLPGLGGIELNESVVRDHPFQERAVQSMWAVNGSMNATEGLAISVDERSRRTSGKGTAGADGTERAVPLKVERKNVPQSVEDAPHEEAAN